MGKELKVKLIGEIGINHNGDINVARDLISLARLAGFDYVKFQKRCPINCIPDWQKNILREMPDGRKITYLQYKKEIEFEEDDYKQLFLKCKNEKIKMFASVWDFKSADFMKKFTNIVKIPSALITNIELLKYCRDNFKTVLMSTGMSKEYQVEDAIAACNPDVIFHTNSAYPTPIEELNFRYIDWLKEKYPEKEIGYSGHEWGLSTTYSIVPRVSWIERHITLNHDMWGSDHKSSIDPIGMFKFCRSVRDIEKAQGRTGPREISDSEIKKLKSLRK